MFQMQDKIWFVNGNYKLSASITFSAEISVLQKGSVPFDQNLKMREYLKDEIYTEVYSHMPQTCKTILKHIKRCEFEMREKGEKILANKLGSSAALVGSLIDQMTVQRPEIDHLSPTEDRQVDLLP